MEFEIEDSACEVIGEELGVDVAVGLGLGLGFVVDGFSYVGADPGEHCFLIKL